MVTNPIQKNLLQHVFLWEIKSIKCHGHRRHHNYTKEFSSFARGGKGGKKEGDMCFVEEHGCEGNIGDRSYKRQWRCVFCRRAWR